MVVCKFFLQGNCRFGESCRFEHQLNDRRTNPTYSSVLRQQSFMPNANPAATATTRNIDLNTLVQAVSNDMIGAEKGRQWLLSCYSPFKEKANMPGFEEQSFEEIRFGYYSARALGSVEQFVQQFQIAQQTAASLIRALQTPTPDAIQTITSIYNSAPSNAGNTVFNANPSVFGQSNTTPQAQTGNSIFGQANQQMFGGVQPQQSSIFGANPSNVAPQSIFGSSTQQQGGFGSPPQQQTIFGGPQPQQGGFGSTQPQQGAFGSTLPPQSGFGSSQPQQGAFSSPLTQPSVFGGAPQVQPSGFGSSQQQGLFTTPQPHQTGFGGTQPQQAGFGSNFSFLGQLQQSATQPNPTSQFNQPPSTNNPSIFNTQPSGGLNSSIFNQQQTNVQPQGFGLPAQVQPQFAPISSQQPSIFGGANVQSSADDDSTYSKLEDLSESDIQTYQSGLFEFGKIPEKPPTREMCF